MMRIPLIFCTALIASPVWAEETRQLDAHEHGVGQLDIAFENEQIAMELHAPGADIVGFEYEAKSAEDRAKIDAAVAMLAQPLKLFGIPADAKCSVVQASAELESEELHAGEHGHDDHEKHAEDKHDDHDHEEHAEDKHDDHDHAEHADDKHDDHDHEEHAESEAGHTEFHAEYLLNCADPSAIESITFNYFETFSNALELEVQIISDTGANAFEVERGAPVLDLRGML